MVSLHSPGSRSGGPVPPLEAIHCGVVSGLGRKYVSGRDGWGSRESQPASLFFGKLTGARVWERQTSASSHRAS